MADFLLELLSEEIPARMQEKACADLARLFAAELAKAGLAAGAIETFATPRRLALIARGLPDATEAQREETKGPRASAPPQALEGFLRKTGVPREALIERDGVLFAIVDRPGRATASVLAEAVPAVVRAFPWPKSMRWGAASASTASLRWVRPLQGIVALLGDDVVPFEIDGVASGAATVGHRFHHPGRITIGSAADYAVKLRAAHVILDPAERRAIIAEGAAQAAAGRGLTLVPDDGLVAENAGLTEWPVPLIGDFDPAFLDVPREVIQLTMRTNQKYFACTSADGRLAPAFVCTANVAAADGGTGIVAGNRKVLAARLADARFFWEQDLKVPLSEQAKKLDRIVFHEKLGTVADKVERVARLARWLAEEGIVPGADPDLAEQAARLAKADLVTGMVGEFPELQGVMGGYYADAEGVSDEVSDAIRDQYRPVGPGDEVPTAPITVAVSLADKLDTLVGFFFAVGTPTGSKDPYGLRRAAISTVRCIILSGCRCSLRTLLQKTFITWIQSTVDWAIAEDQDFRTFFEGLRERRRHPILVIADLLVHVENLSVDDPEFDAVKTRLLIRQETRERVTISAALIAGSKAGESDLVNFLIDRLKVQQREAGVRHDLIDAVFALGGEDDLVRLLARVRALQAFVATEDGTNLLAGYKRAANILKKEGWAGVADAMEEPAGAVEHAEAALAAALDAAETETVTAVTDERFEDAMAALAALRAPIDAFFEQVTVNDPDLAKRAARLALLARIRDAIHRVADFSKIEG